MNRKTAATAAAARKPAKRATNNKPKPKPAKNAKTAANNKRRKTQANIAAMASVSFDADD